MARAKTSRRRKLRSATQLVHGGILRSQFGENSESLFLTQSYVYDSAEQAAARFKGTEPGYIYSRFANPTVAMFEVGSLLPRTRSAVSTTPSSHAPTSRPTAQSCKGAAPFLTPYPWIS